MCKLHHLLFRDVHQFHHEFIHISHMICHIEVLVGPSVVSLQHRAIDIVLQEFRVQRFAWELVGIVFHIRYTLLFLFEEFRVHFLIGIHLRE